MPSLLRAESELQAQADALLECLALRPCLARYGRLLVVGAKAMGLLVDRDIDLHVYPPTLSLGVWLEVTRALAALPGVQSLRLHNLWDYAAPDFEWREPGRPRNRGYLTELSFLRIPASAGVWHIDLWLLPDGEPDEAADWVGRMATAVAGDPGLRPAILRMKNDLVDLALPRRLPSVCVYRAAIEDGARDLPALVEALRAREPGFANLLAGALAAPTGGRTAAQAREEMVGEKLVRDGIPALMAARGQSGRLRMADRNEMHGLLLAKVREEAGEVIASGGQVDEVADLIDVLEALVELGGGTVADILEARAAKRRRNGGFGRGCVLQAPGRPT